MKLNTWCCANRPYAWHLGLFFTTFGKPSISSDLQKESTLHPRPQSLISIGGTYVSLHWMQLRGKFVLKSFRSAAESAFWLRFSGFRAWELGLRAGLQRIEMTTFLLHTYHKEAFILLRNVIYWINATNKCAILLLRYGINTWYSSRPWNDPFQNVNTLDTINLPQKNTTDPIKLRIKFWKAFLIAVDLSQKESFH